MLLQANSRVVLIKTLEIDGELRTFALTFGYARFLFREDILEEQFGLRIVLNSIKQNELRRSLRQALVPIKNRVMNNYLKAVIFRSLALMSTEIS